MALLAVLWALGLLALLGAMLLAIARHDAWRGNEQRNAAATEAAARGALQHAIFALLDPSPAGWRADGVWRRVTISGIRVAIRIDDEAIKVNPNLAEAPLLRALLMVLGADPAAAMSLAASMIDWRSAVDAPERRGAPLARYQQAGGGYAPAGGPFSRLDELGVVPGMTPEMLARLRPHLTLFTTTDTEPSRYDPVVTQALAVAGDAREPENAGRPNVVSITLDAAGSDHSRLGLRYVVRLDVRSRGPAWAILSCERTAADGS
jgi:general secretion pathway protein K